MTESELCSDGHFVTFFMFRYTRNLISTTDKFNLILLCWSEGNASSIHDHTDSECIMKALKGNNLGRVLGRKIKTQTPSIILSTNNTVLY